MFETVKNCNVSTRAMQVLLRSVIRSVNTVERKIQKIATTESRDKTPCTVTGFKSLAYNIDFLFNGIAKH